MDLAMGERHIMEWDESDVHSWLSSLGYPQYELQIRDHNISGDVLCILDSEGLKGIGVATIGQRLAILKAVYNVKLAHNVPIEADHYIPPSEAQDREGITVEKLYDIVKDQTQRLRTLEEDNRRLNDSLQLFLDDFNTLQTSQRRPSDSGLQGTLHRQPSFKWAQYVKPARSPTKPDIIESPQPSPQQLEHDVPYSRNTSQYQQYQSTSTPPQKPQPPPPPPLPISESPSTTKPHRQESSDNLKSFKVSLDDPTWKVLPAALKKYKINNDNWQNYAMFICFGSTGNRIERCLSYDEKPLLLFQKLKDAKKNPVFMLKHIKDIRSPIAVAQQKHAARKASSSEPSTSSHGRMQTSSGRSHTRPPRLEVHDLTTTPNPGGVSPQPPWLEVMSPGIEKEKPDELGGMTPTASLGPSVNEILKNKAVATEGESHGSGHVRETPVALAGVSYAVAIYPYMAEQEDEFDVVVGDTFVILSRARGWWVVQRDPSGSGIVDTDMTKQGWVPAGCLLETNVPVASAIKLASSGNSPPPSPSNRKTPILPLSIISTSFPGIALMDYEKKGEEELDLVKDEPLRVFKRYNHWSYAVKEEGGDRGWVPSWFIGKVATASGVPPATPSTSAASTTLNSASMSLESENSQVSPMSSAFPPVRSATTMI